MLKKKSILIKVSDSLLASGPALATSISSFYIFGEPKLPAKLKRNKDKQKAGE